MTQYITVTKTTTRFTKIDGIYEVVSEDSCDITISADEYFPEDYWINELIHVSFY